MTELASAPPGSVAAGSIGAQSSPISGPSETPRPSLDPAALAERGPGGVAVRTFEFRDPDRGDRPVAVRIWYPAQGGPGKVTPDAAPDPLGVPYPIILGSEEISAFLGEHLASHGYAFVAGLGQRSWLYHHPSPLMVDFPLDLMTALDGLAALEEDPLAGVLDTDRAGVADYSFGAWTALMLAGARVDPDHYRATCADRPLGWSDFWFGYVCGTPANWDEFVERGEEAGVAPASGMWDTFGDARIKAVMPMMPEGFDLVGARGLASAQASALFIAGSADTINDYDPAAVSLFEHYPAGSASMVTFVGADHFLILEDDGLTQIRRLATAFFDACLRGAADAAGLLTESWIEGEATTFEPHSSYETLAWGALGPSGP